MKNQYIVRMANNRLFAFYHSEDSGILQRDFDSGRWSKPSPIAADAQDDFTISTDKHGTLYMFCQDTQGDVHLYRLRQEGWKSRLILKNPSNKQSRLKIYPIIADNEMSIIYNNITDGESGTLILQRMNKNGKWHPPINIDNYTHLRDGFSLQAITPDHALLFYTRKSAESTIGYVEISPEHTTAFNSIYSTNHRITDTSFLVTDTSLHTLFIVKGLFSTQLIYRKKSKAAFSAPIVVAEGSQINNCLLMYVSGKLNAYFVANGQLFCASSSNMGDSFSGVTRCPHKFCASPTKSVYISQIPMDEGAYFARQLYVDHNNLADVQLLPDMYDNFYPMPVNTTNPPQEPSPEAEASLAIYKTKLERAQIQLLEKDRQLTNLATSNNEERLLLQNKITTLEQQLHNLQSTQPASNPPQDSRTYPLMII